jgi:hypothetical protein
MYTEKSFFVAKVISSIEVCIIIYYVYVSIPPARCVVGRYLFDVRGLIYILFIIRLSKHTRFMFYGLTTLRVYFSIIIYVHRNWKLYFTLKSLNVKAKCVNKFIDMYIIYILISCVRIQKRFTCHYILA